MNYLNNIYLEYQDASKYKIMDAYYTGMTNNILEKLREQPYNLKIEQSPYTEDLNKIKYSITIPGLDENKIEKVIPSKYITIFLKDDKSDNEVSFYLTSTETSTEFPEGVYKNIEVKKGQITAKHSCIFK